MSLSVHGIIDAISSAHPSVKAAFAVVSSTSVLFSVSLLFRSTRIVPLNETVRLKEKAYILDRIESMFPGNFIVVHGPGGFGKTTLVHDAVKNHHAVQVEVLPGKAADTIEKLVEDAVAGPLFQRFNKYGYWKCVISAKTSFGKKFVVILDGRARKANQDPASLVVAARSISDEFRGKVAVIVDASDNAYAPHIESPNGWQYEISVQPLTKKELIELPQYKTVHSTLKNSGLVDNVYAVLGGSPRLWEQFRQGTIRLLVDADKTMIENATLTHLLDVINGDEGYKLIRKSITDFGENVKKRDAIFSTSDLHKRVDDFHNYIYSEFSKNPSTHYPSSTFDDFPDRGFIPDGNNVIRESRVEVVLSNGEVRSTTRYVPCSPILDFVLRHNIRTKITDTELKEFLKKDHEAGITLK